MSQITVDEAMRVAVQHHQGGRFREAEGLYRQILTQEPNHAQALQLLGVLAGQTGRPDVAVNVIRRAIAICPNDAAYYNNLSKFLTDLGRLDEAIAACREAVRLQPGFAEAHHNLGDTLYAQGKYEEATASYRHVLSLKPELAEVHNSLGVLLRNQGKIEEARASYLRAIELKPDYPEAHNNLGNLLVAGQQFDEAIIHYRRAVELRPSLIVAHRNLGNALHRRRKLTEAIAAYRDALQLNPAHGETFYHLGNVLKDARRLDEAVKAYRRALGLQPNHADAHNNLGNVLKDFGQLDDAIASLRDAVRFRPDFANAHSNLVYTLNFHPGYDGRAICEELRGWNQLHAEPLKKLIKPHANDRDPDRRLRIGYVSPDFRDHVVGRNLLPLLREHGHGQVEVFCYSNVAAPDALTRQFKAYADHWRDISKMSDQETADRIREDRIDILVDLTLQMSNHRLLVFAQKPAPVQATFAGYPGTTGLETMDYRLTDPYLDAPGSGDGCYSEASIRLPDSFWCYDPLGEIVDVNPPPALENGKVTFGCLNNFCKINDGVLALWGKVLGAVEGARLMLSSAEGMHRAHAVEVLQRGGVASERVEFVTPCPRLAYLKLYHRIDLGLDTLPYNGHTTSLDSFWMGVPVLTLVGQTAVGRAGLSQLMNLGLPELIARTPEEYVRIAVELAKDLPRLAALRSGLRGRMQGSPLMDAPRFARGIEAAYRQMWKRWCA